MSFKAFLNGCLLEYVVITTCVTAAIAVLGISLDPTATIGYEGFFSPLIFAAVSLLPSLVTYSSKELTLRQTLVRKVLHLILLEGTLIGFGYWAGLLHSASDAFYMGLTIILVTFAVNLIRWHLDKKEADDINRTLKALQGRD